MEHHLPPPSDDMDQAISSLIDTNSDDSWSADELTAFTDALNSSTDSAAIIAKYDVNNDGSIDSSERAKIKEDDALELASSTETTSENKITTSSYINKVIQAYSMQSGIDSSTAQNALYNLAV